MVTKVIVLSINANWYESKGIDVSHLRKSKWEDAREWLTKQLKDGEQAFSISEMDLSTIKHNDNICGAYGDNVIIWFI